MKELVLKDITVTFRKKEALKNVNLSLVPKIYGLVGENGAGKTTLFRSILGLQKYKGSVCKQGISTIGYVPQKFDTLHGLNLIETLQYFCCLQGIPKEEQLPLAMKLLKKVNLLEEKEKKVRELSGGMLRRLGIAQALINDPDLLIMDEPTVGLDPVERVRLRDIINDIKAERIIMISSHEIREIEHICEAIIFIHQGRIVCCDTVEALYERYQTQNMEDIYFKIIQGVD